jgi:hypothetical protein
VWEAQEDARDNFVSLSWVMPALLQGLGVDVEGVGIGGEKGREGGTAKKSAPLAMIMITITNKRVRGNTKNSLSFGIHHQGGEGEDQKDDAAGQGNGPYADSLGNHAPSQHGQASA